MDHAVGGRGDADCSALLRKARDRLLLSPQDNVAFQNSNVSAPSTTFMDSNFSFCSRRARASGNSIQGTATEALTWLLVEVPAPWGRKALPESDLPPEVKSLLATWESEAAGRRVQFIRRETNVFDVPGQITVYVACVDTKAPELYKLHLDEYTDLLQLGLKGLNTRPLPWNSSRCSEPLFLTCTNGRRDACCAKFGRELAKTMTDSASTIAWQTTHLGGHRFAPTLLVLPHGSHYGWLDAGEAASLVEAHRRGRLYRLDRYRGHVGFSPPVQAAAVFLRKSIECRDLGTLSLLEAVQEDRSAWRVHFRTNDREYEVRVVQEEGETMPVSCGKAPELTSRFVLDGCHLI